MGASAGCVNKVMTGVIDITRNCGSVRINIDNTCYRVVNILDYPEINDASPCGCGRR